MMHVGDIMSTLEDTMSTLGGYHEHIMMFSTLGDIMMHVRHQVSKNLSNSIETPDILNIPQCTHDILDVLMTSLDVLKVSP